MSSALAPEPNAILQVALDTPLRRLFDYLPPPDCAPQQLKPGQRLRVPFGRQTAVGVLVGISASSALPHSKLRAALELIDREPVFAPKLLALLRWAADYYHHPLGNVLTAALPALARDGASAQALIEYWSLTPAGATAHREGAPQRAPRQRQLLDLLASGGASAEQLDTANLGWREAARALLRRDWIVSSDVAAPPSVEPELRATTTDVSAVLRSAGPTLSAEQQAAVTAIAAANGQFRCFLLRGITGSGKTEVYLQAAARVLERGGQVLVLVPEISLTPQLIERLQTRFLGPIVALHSGLSDAQRLAAWRDCLTGRPGIVIGTRSAVFAPLPQLGLIVVDEEHDASFKQQEGGFRYSARDLAVVRAQELGIPLVLGSATPALESLHNVALGRYHRLELPTRAAGASPPQLKLLDVRGQKLHHGLSGQALSAIESHLAAAGQVLVYINRRGYAPTLICSACGWIAPCTQCDARLTVHRQAERLRCHHCGYERAVITQCTQCGYAVKTVGQGTERVEEALQASFPKVPMLRLDRDVVRSGADLATAYAAMQRGAARLLVGTQMVTKGHDFPEVTLVVVLNADQGLFSTEYRAAERLAQTLIQVAGRAGRGARAGEVLIQTEHPDHPLLNCLLAEGYEGFARLALADRQSARWPPFARLAALRASAPALAPAVEFLRAARTFGGEIARKLDVHGVQLQGPAPATMARRAGRYHAQLLVECRERAPLQRFLSEWIDGVETLPQARRVRFALDVDPLELF